MNSYNCFYSALYELLEPYYLDKTSLLIHNRWQFFYKNSLTYSDDRRFVGESPMLYDEYHCDSLYRHLNIAVDIRPGETPGKICELLGTQGSVLIFADKCRLLSPKISAERGRCVTTVKLILQKAGLYFYELYDSDMTVGHYSPLDDIIYAWENASEYEFLNRCIITVRLDRKAPQDAAIDAVVKNNLFHSITDYLQGGGGENGYVFGRKALNIMADDLENWENTKFIDGAMYIQTVKEQRKCFMPIVRQYLHTTYRESLCRRLSGIVDQWDKLKLMLYLVEKRQQKQAVHHIKRLILDIAKTESEFLSDVEYHTML